METWSAPASKLHNLCKSGDWVLQDLQPCACVGTSKNLWSSGELLLLPREMATCKNLWSSGSWCCCCL
jgi:hypothetical protein